MILYLAVAALTIALACFVDNSRAVMEAGGNKHRFLNTGKLTRRQALNGLCLLAVFTILFLLSALRLEVGNDYGTYVDTFHEIYVGGYVVTEPLFNAVVKCLFVLSGGENYLLAFAFFGFVTIWLFLKVLYEQSENFAFAFFLFMTLGLYFRTFNTVRYYLVLAITLYSFRYIFRREYGKFIALIFVASLLHKSVLIVIPLYLLAKCPWRKWLIAVMGAGAFSLLLFQDFYMQLALKLYPSYENTIYLETEVGLAGSILSIGRCLAVLLLALFLYKEAVQNNEENAFYFKLNILAVLLYTCMSFLPLVSRFGYYLMTSHVLFLPSLLGELEEGKRKKIIRGLIIAAGILYFLQFLRTASGAGVRVLPYKSWLFYEKEFLNAGEIF